jgi:hypothetical protein
MKRSTILGKSHGKIHKNEVLSFVFRLEQVCHQKRKDRALQAICSKCDSNILYFSHYILSSVQSASQEKSNKDLGKIGMKECEFSA